jgi:NAD(P)-dependent dehydrogenase (short-subunit alcohol dehydrogenase family)
MTRLDGKVLIVTGATRGIGLATAERLGAEGARVVLAARGEDAGRAVEARLRAAGSDVVFVAADMTDEAGAVAAVETAVARFGRLDGAFNNVGGVAAPGRPADIDAADWGAELRSTSPARSTACEPSCPACWPPAEARSSTTPRSPEQPGSAG